MPDSCPASLRSLKVVRSAGRWRFVEQVCIPQKYENGDWRRATGQEAESVLRRSILPEIGELRCRDLKREHLVAVLRKRAQDGVCFESVGKVRPRSATW